MSRNQLSEALVTEIGRQKHQAVFEYSQEEKKFVYLSPGFIDIWEGLFTSEDIESDQLLSTIHPDDTTYLKQVARAVLKGHQHHTAEARIRLPGNRVKWLQIDFYALNAEISQEPHLAGIIKDVTIAKRNMLYLLDVNERKNMTLQILGHDLRNPIAAIEAASCLLERSLATNKTDNIEYFIASIKHACQKSNTLIQNVITSELLESKELQPHKKRFDLAGCVFSLVELYKAADGVGKKTIRLQCPEKLFVIADEVKIMLCIENLVSNALKFTKEAGNILLRLAIENEELIIEVTDDGIGIPADQQMHVFEKFSKAGRKGLQGEDSLGLGLHIIKYLVEIHKGHIAFVSNEQGTTFTISIPQ
jgi:two-component system, OmpR family, sensor histidine kinase VicK